MSQGTRTENTAVNRLIEMAHERPLEADDALFSGSPRKTLPPPFRARIPTSTHTAITPAPPAPRVARADVTRPLDPIDIDMDVDDLADADPDHTPIPRPKGPLPVAPPQAPAHLTPDDESWYQATTSAERIRFDEFDAPEVRHQRRARTRSGAGTGRARTLLWLSAAFAAGLVATAIVAWPAKSVVSSAPPPVAAIAAPVAVPAAAPAPKAQPVAPPAVVVAPVVVVAPAPAPVAVVEEEAPPPAPVVEKRAAKAAPRVEKRVARAEPIKVLKSTAPSGGGGVLMLGAKPPCDIFIDGKATGLKTPQRALKVSPGSHKVTLVNREHKITESFAVNVKAGASTKVVKDLTRRMK